LWQSVEDEELPELTEETVAMLNKRFEEYLADPSLGIPWEEARVQLEERKAKIRAERGWK
jgi:putative addiction module component (TIGR02574 family)